LSNETVYIMFRKEQIVNENTSVGSILQLN